MKFLFHELHIADFYSLFCHFPSLFFLMTYCLPRMQLSSVFQIFYGFQFFSLFVWKIFLLIDIPYLAQSEALYESSLPPR